MVNAYTYDNAGNRLSKVSSKDGIIATNVYSYDEQNRLTETVATTTGSSAEVHTYFGYDNNGNQISKWVQSVGVSDGENSVTLGELGVNTAGDMALYSYDNFNRLTGILQGNTTIQNAYNGRGRKISRTTDGKTRYYVYDGNTVIAELDGQNELKARNVYGRNLISRTTDKPMIMSYNGHGDIVLVKSVSGETLAEYAYDEFGNVLAQNGELDNPYRYAGYEYLDSVDLYDLNARYYNPKTARFLSEDPYYNLGNRVIGLYEINVPSVLSIMQANALYVYCGNAPVRLIDSYGNFAVEVIYSPVVQEFFQWLLEYLAQINADVTVFIAQHSAEIQEAANYIGLYGEATWESFSSWMSDTLNRSTEQISEKAQNASKKSEEKSKKSNNSQSNNTSNKQPDKKPGKNFKGFNNKRVMENVKIKGYNVSMDLEKGPQQNNIHLEINGHKYMYNEKAQAFLDDCGKTIPNSLKDNAQIEKALEKAYKLIAQGW